MSNSLFWKAAVVIALAAAFYLGRGSHQKSSDTGRAYAADVKKEPENKKMPLRWNSVGMDGDQVYTGRAKVKGGWLVFVRSNPWQNPAPTGLTFVPDADHSWQP